MRIRRLSAVLLATALGAATVVTGATPAQAEPTDCTISVTAEGYTSYCASGTGYHLIGVSWKHPNPQMPESGVWYGEWAPVGGKSVVKPPFAREITGVGVVKKG
ncbi:hypothetical protein [Streptosporangium carneum]|uniref:Secreted protein n=1 Tax=Streptosporangium carneum TaxID=47481 RepID=A0A9W6MHC4_9ACTN|nr:hypothetical protein [Streptosporangium carneum]GLK14096.1 hypothetical protein GCM10017600_75080 [Streptosporangium carneum]